MPAHQPGEAPDLAALFFELSHANRLALLTRLSAGEEHLTNLARELDASPQEASRHLSRLAEAGLAVKLGSGAYALTPLGRAVVGQLDAYRVLVRHRDYFREHDVSVLPVEFRGSVGVLEGARLLTRNVEVVREVRVLLEDAEEYILNLAPSAFDYGYPLVAEKSRKGVTYRAVFEQGYAESDFHRGLVREHNFDLRRVQTATVESLGFWLLLNESRALVGFFYPDGAEDLSHAFVGEDPDVHAWCRHLFEHHWVRARAPGRRLPWDQL